MINILMRTSLLLVLLLSPFEAFMLGFDILQYMTCLWPCAENMYRAQKALRGPQGPKSLLGIIGPDRGPGLCQGPGPGPRQGPAPGKRPGPGLGQGPGPDMGQEPGPGQGPG